MLRGSAIEVELQVQGQRLMIFKCQHPESMQAKTSKFKITAYFTTAKNGQKKWCCKVPKPNPHPTRLFKLTAPILKPLAADLGIESKLKPKPKIAKLQIPSCYVNLVRYSLNS